MFDRCSSLIYLPDISKWNTENIKYMNYMFFGCEQLVTIPDISKWNCFNTKQMNYIFKNCFSLISFSNSEGEHFYKEILKHEFFLDCPNFVLSKRKSF